jgi:hypothetical protein
MQPDGGGKGQWQQNYLRSLPAMIKASRVFGSPFSLVQHPAQVLYPTPRFCHHERRLLLTNQSKFSWRIEQAVINNAQLFQGEGCTAYDLVTSLRSVR